jgi:Domain of unknown function (DUF4395)
MKSSFFTFPNPVNEVAVRITAGGVLTMAIVLLATRQPLILLVLAYGFVARTLAGPRISPMALLSTRVIVPRLPLAPKYTPGPPKRFAQSIGAAMTMAGAILAFGFGISGAAYVVAGILVIFAALESIGGYCVGCKIFSLLMSAHVIPQSVCEECANIWLRAKSPVPNTVSSRQA